MATGRINVAWRDFAVRQKAGEMAGDGLGLACAEAFAQHFHAGFKVVQGAGAHPGVPVADEIVGVADQLQQLTAVMFAKFGGGQLQVEQADVRQFGQIDGEQRAVGTDFSGRRTAVRR